MNGDKQQWRPMVFGNPSTRLRSARSMPQWMTSPQQGVGPPPPPVPSSQHHSIPQQQRISHQSSTEPDYEVIEYRGGVGQSHQQQQQQQQEYSNTPPALPQKTTVGGRGKAGHCDLCGASGPRVKCDKCAQQIFCLSCDDMYHRHPKRQSHIRKALDVGGHNMEQVRPPLPPKGEPLSAPPVPPPRRNKRAGSVTNSPCPSPMLPRHMTDQVARKETQAFSLKDKVGSLKRIMSGRPLPSAPHGISSRSEFSGSPPPQSPGAQSITSDGQRRDRFSSLQERYRQHQIAMKAMDMERQNSTSGWTQSSSTQSPSAESNFSYPGCDSNNNPNDWNNRNQVGPSRARSSSISAPQKQDGFSQVHSGFATVGRRKPSFSGQSTGGFKSPPPVESPQFMQHSASVFDLNSMPDQPMPQHFNPMSQQQAMSMAQLNYPYQWTDQWGNYIGPQQGNGSNLSLNMMPPGYPMWMPQQYPQGWRGPMPMYPYPVNMPPPVDDRRSRAHSPAMSTKSRKSQMSRMTNTNRRRKSKDDDDDRRSIRSYTHHRDNESAERMSVSRRPPRNISSRTVSPLPLTRKLSTRSSMSVERDTKKHLPVTRVPESTSSSEVESESEPGVDSDIESEEEMEISDEEPEKIEVDESRIDTPPYEWICEHCTFNNSPNTRICSVCCKTPTSMPQKSVPKSSGTISTTQKKKSVKKDAAVGASSPTKSIKKPPPVDEINHEFKQCRVSSATESVADEIYEQLNAKPSSITSSTSKKKGNLRKISFWPGTKFPTLGK